MLPRRRPPSSRIPRTSFVHSGSGRPPPRKPLSAVTRVIVSVVLLALMAVSLDSVTSRHVEVSSSETIGGRGIEVEGRAIARQRGTPVIRRAVYRGPQVHGSRPPGTRLCTRRGPPGGT